MDVVIATEHVNRKGYSLLVAGARLDNYRRNPVILYMHRRDEERFPAARMENLRIENNQLLGTPVFDEEDERGQQMKRKFEKGFLNAVSIHADPIAWSEDPKLLKQGQYRPTLTEWDLLEVSFVDIPGDANAVRLSHDEDNEIIPELKHRNMEPVKTALALSADATETDVVAAIEKLRSDRNKTLIALGVSKGAIAKDQETVYLSLAESNYTATETLILAAPSKPGTGSTDAETLSAILEKLGANTKPPKDGDGDGDGEEEETFEKLQRENPSKLLQLKVDDPEAYRKLVDAYIK